MSELRAHTAPLCRAGHARLAMFTSVKNGDFRIPGKEIYLLNGVPPMEKANTCPFYALFGGNKARKHSGAIADV